MSRVRQAKRKYREFHGVPPDRIIKVEAPDLPPQLVILGELVEIVYKPAGAGPTARKGEYIHEFGDYGDRMSKEKPLLATDPAGKQLFIVKRRSKFKIGRRGIVG